MFWQMALSVYNTFGIAKRKLAVIISGVYHPCSAAVTVPSYIDVVLLCLGCGGSFCEGLFYELRNDYSVRFVL